MNKYNFAVVMGMIASISLSVGSFGSVLAQDNTTMSTDNMTSTMDNSTGNQTFTPVSEIPSMNTSEITDAERGIDANKIIGQ
jgi:hypothetical protein